MNLAFDAQARALKDDPSVAESRIELERLAGEANAWDKLDAIFDEIARGLADAALARDYWMRLAHIDERLGKVEEAAKGYVHILSQNPADAEALEALDSLYRRTERWNDLIGVYRRRIELTGEVPQQEALYAQMAEGYERLGSPEDAILAKGPRSTTPAGWRCPASTLSTRVEDVGRSRGQPRFAASPRADGRGRRAFMLRLAGLREREMNQIGVRQGYRRVLGVIPPTAGASLSSDSARQANETSIAEILEPLSPGGSFQKLIGVHEDPTVERSMRRWSPPKSRRCTRMCRRSERGLRHLRRALSGDPNELTQQGLDRLARARPPSRISPACSKS